MTETADHDAQLEGCWRQFCHRPDEAAFAPLYAASKATVYSLSFRILRTEEDAIDAFQATYCRLLQIARSGEAAGGSGGFRLLIYRLVLREARNLKARRSRLRSREQAMDNFEQLAAVDPSQQRILHETETRRIAEALLARLPDEQNEVMALHLFGDLNQTEIARLLGVSKMTVSRRVEQARRRLEMMLRQSGIEHPARGAALPVPIAGLLRQPPDWLSAQSVFSHATLHQNAAAAAAFSPESGAALPPLGTVGALFAILLLVGALFLIPRSGPATVAIRGGSFEGWIGRQVAGSAIPLNRNSAPAIDTPALGINMAEWTSPYALIQFEPGSIYRFRLRLHADRAMPGHTPLWFAIVDNYSPEIGRGSGGFSVKYEWLDYMGGANGPRLPGGEGRENFEAWVVPPASLTPAWKDQTSPFFARQNDENRGARFRFGVLDSDRAGILADEDEGILSLDELQIERYALADLRREALVYRATGGSAPDGAALAVDAVTNTSVMTGEAWLRLIPRDETGFYDSLAVVTPGLEPLDFASAASVAEHYPIEWEPDQLYLVEADLEAGRDLMADGRMVEFRFGMDTPTQEVAAMSLLSNGLGGASLPQPGRPQTFVGLFHSHTPSLTDSPHLKRLRPRMDFLWRARPDGSVFSGSQSWIALHGLRIYKASLQPAKGNRIHPLDNRKGD